MKKLSIVLGTAAIAVSGASFAAAAPMAAPAATSNWYAGAGFNYPAMMKSRVNHDTKIAKKKVGYNLFAGKRINKWVGAEVGFNYFGKLTTKASGAEYKVKDAWDVYLDGVAYLPVCQYVDLFAKGGPAYLQLKDSYAGNGTYAKLKTMAINYGFGVQVNYQQFGARLSYNDFIVSNSGKEINGTTHDYRIPNTIGLDVMYSFG